MIFLADSPLADTEIDFWSVEKPVGHPPQDEEIRARSIPSLEKQDFIRKKRVLLKPEYLLTLSVKYHLICLMNWLTTGSS
jgi:hypothetical protein